MATTRILAGTYRIVHRDSNDNTIAELLEKPELEFGGAVTGAHDDPQKMPKVKKALSTVLREDDQMVIMFKPSETKTEHATPGETQTFRVPVTFRNRRSGVVYEKTLIYGDFTEVRATGVASQVWTKDVWYDLLKYSIPAQSELKMGHAIQDVRVDSALMLFESYIVA